MLFSISPGQITLTRKLPAILTGTVTGRRCPARSLRSPWTMTPSATPPPAARAPRPDLPRLGQWLVRDSR
ncbi:MAG TPA: hypothetical protein VFB06_15790 [Streptosporangiaceae bacterium]|nr:hypothetical protein [Streptosporangiaceae bacterium]